MKQRFIDKAAVKAKARGNWLMIISKIAPFLTDATMKVGHHCTCPVHGGLDGFRFYKDVEDTGGGVCNTCGNYPDGLSLLAWATGKSFYDVLKDVAEFLGTGEFKAVARAKRPVLPTIEDPQVIENRDKVRRGHLRATYATSIDISAPGSALARKYLQSRGLNVIPKGLRFHPALSYKQEDGTNIFLPGIVAMVTGPKGSGPKGAVTMHRTYLDAATGAKASVKDPKRLMPHTSDTSLHGSAIKLFEPTGETLAVAEGIETAIAVYEATGIACWATVSTTFMATFEPPANIKRVIVFADKDRKEQGLNAAKKLVEALWAKGVQASIEIPPSEIPEKSKGIDWLDELVTHGKTVFPKVA